MIELQFISNEEIIQKVKMNNGDFYGKILDKSEIINEEKCIIDRESIKNIWIKCFYNKYIFNDYNFYDYFKINMIKIMKIKDPRKVELGKRVAKISLEAKARKKLEREKQNHNNIDFKCYIAFFIAFGELYFLYKMNKIKENQKMLILNSIILD